MVLTQKEKELLKDLKNEEQLCSAKYTKYSAEAHDPQLKNLFSQIAQSERHHLDLLCKLENGTVEQFEPSGTIPTFTQSYPSNSPEKQADEYLCSDLLATEKHASNLYDTCVFEFNDENARMLLNHIQTQEQQHGKMLYDYMSVNKMSA